MKELEKWQRKYNMTQREWDEPYFKELIGGIEVTAEEKKEAFLEIKGAIYSNKCKEKIVKIKKEIFLKTYPQSINLLTDYYDSLIEIHNINQGLIKNIAIIMEEIIKRGKKH